MIINDDDNVRLCDDSGKTLDIKAGDRLVFIAKNPYHCSMLDGEVTTIHNDNRILLDHSLSINVKNQAFIGLL